MTTPTGPDVPIANSALRPLAGLIGEWRTTGSHPLVPGTTFHGRTSLRWHEGGAFVRMRSEVDEPEIPDGVAIIGSDDAASTFTMVYFDERDVSRRYDVEVADGEVSWSRDEAGFAQRMVLTIDPGGRRSWPRERCPATAPRGRATSSSPTSGSTPRATEPSAGSAPTPTVSGSGPPLHHCGQGRRIACVGGDLRRDHG